MTSAPGLEYRVLMEILGPISEAWQLGGTRRLLATSNVLQMVWQCARK